MAAAQPESNDELLHQPGAQLLYSRATSITKICRIHTPPSSWRLMANVCGSQTANASAPNLTTRDAHWDTRVSSRGEASGLKYSLKMFLVNRFAAAIAMIAAGTRAPMMMAANEIPVNQLGNMCWS